MGCTRGSDAPGALRTTPRAPPHRLARDGRRRLARAVTPSHPQPAHDRQAVRCCPADTPKPRSVPRPGGTYGRGRGSLRLVLRPVRLRPGRETYAWRWGGGGGGGGAGSETGGASSGTSGGLAPRQAELVPGRVGAGSEASGAGSDVGKAGSGSGDARPGAGAADSQSDGAGPGIGETRYGINEASSQIGEARSGSGDARTSHPPPAPARPRG